MFSALETETVSKWTVSETVSEWTQEISYKRKRKTSICMREWRSGWQRQKRLFLEGDDMEFSVSLVPTSGALPSFHPPAHLAWGAALSRHSSLSSPLESFPIFFLLFLFPCLPLSWSLRGPRLEETVTVTSFSCFHLFFLSLTQFKKQRWIEAYWAWNHAGLTRCETPITKGNSPAKGHLGAISSQHTQKLG